MCPRAKYNRGAASLRPELKRLTQPCHREFARPKSAEPWSSLQAPMRLPARSLLAQASRLHKQCDPVAGLRAAPHLEWRVACRLGAANRLRATDAVFQDCGQAYRLSLI